MYGEKARVKIEEETDGVSVVEGEGGDMTRRASGAIEMRLGVMTWWAKRPDLPFCKLLPVHVLEKRVAHDRLLATGAAPKSCLRVTVEQLIDKLLRLWRQLGGELHLENRTASPRERGRVAGR